MRRDALPCFAKSSLPPPFNLLLAPDSKCDLHMLLSERLLPLDSLLKLGKLPEGALQELAITALSKAAKLSMVASSAGTWAGGTGAWRLEYSKQRPG